MRDLDSTQCSVKLLGADLWNVSFLSIITRRITQKGQFGPNIHLKVVWDGFGHQRLPIKIKATLKFGEHWARKDP